MVQEILFLTLINMHIQLVEKKLVAKTYIAIEVVSTIRWVELIYKEEFAKVALDKDVGSCVVYLSFLSLRSMMIHPT